MILKEIRDIPTSTPVTLPVNKKLLQLRNKSKDVINLENKCNANKNYFIAKARIIREERETRGFGDRYVNFIHFVYMLN